MPEVEKQIKTGNIQTVDKDSKAIKVKSDAGDLALGIDEDTTITVNGYYKTISDLNAGQKVKKIYYVERGAEKLATIIHVIDEKLLQAGKGKKTATEKEERKPAI